MRIAIIGTGEVAGAIAPQLRAAGHAVVLGSREPQRRPAWMSEEDSSIELASHKDAVASADVVVNALPGAQAVGALSALRDQLDGKVVMDLANAIVPSDSGPALAYPNGSLAEELRAALPGARIVKAMNTISAVVMKEPGGLTVSSSLFTSGDDEAAKKTVIALLGDLGWAHESIIDLGGLETARGPEHLFPLLVALYGLGGPRMNLAVIR